MTIDWTRRTGIEIGTGRGISNAFEVSPNAG
jgi:hypothetical protein